MADPADASAEAAVVERYARFARDEAPGRSEVYRRWAEGVSRTPDVAALLARIPAAHRQPPLVFAVTRRLGATDGGFGPWSAWLAEHIDAVVAECTARTVQTNEPLRAAALLPVLSLLDGPLAIVEVGASAGLCLYPDRYSYRYRTAEGEVRVDPDDGESTVVLHADLRGAPRLKMPEIVWRAGIDLHPLDATDPADRDWLTGLVWPGEEGRRERITAALDIVAADPPRLVVGDAADPVDDIVADVVAAAPRGARVVVTTPGVLPYLSADGRARVVTQAARADAWITLDHPSLHGWTPAAPRPWPSDRFALALDGRVLATADPLGGTIDWLGGAGAEWRSGRTHRAA